MRIVKNVLFWLSTVCLVVAILLVAVPKLFGVEFRAVVTGSMTPEIPVGSLVVVVPTKAEDIRIGDDITFVTKGERVVTHRVVEIDLEKNEFTTWGIANDPSAIDAPNKYENILGVVRFHIPRAGQVFHGLTETRGKIIAATVVIAAYILSSIVGLWVTDKKKKPAAAFSLDAGSAGMPDGYDWQQGGGLDQNAAQQSAVQAADPQQNQLYPVTPQAAQGADPQQLQQPQAAAPSQAQERSLIDEIDDILKEAGFLDE